jgi:hypothetical protein
MFNPDKLKDVVGNHGGFAFSDKYLVEFLSMPSLRFEFQDLKLLSLTCENTSLPTRSIQASEKLIYGTSYQMPYKHAYGEISMTFYLTEDLVLKSFFDAWLDKIIDPLTGDIGYYKDYTCDIKISKFKRSATNENANPAYAVKLFSAWPSIVAEVAMTHASTDIAKLPITFQYKKWLDFTTATYPNTGPAGGG